MQTISQNCEYYFGTVDGFYMLKITLTNITRFLETNRDFLTSEHAKQLLEKTKLSITTHKSMNFYAMNVDAQLVNLFENIHDYITDMQQLAETLRMQVGRAPQLSEIEHYISLLEKKSQKICHFRDSIPQGMLDVKRTMFFAKAVVFSTSPEEDASLKQHFSILRAYMSSLNDQYTAIISQGGSVYSFLAKITSLYWTKLHDYTQHLKQLYAYLKHSSYLTNEGQFIIRCFDVAIGKLPSEQLINRAIKQLNTSKKSIKNTLKNVGFFSRSGEIACVTLSEWTKPFFHMPSSDSIYHFDYQPDEDLAGTGGNCFGESMTFIQALCIGKFKHFCPEPALINFQLDQTHTLKFGKETLGVAETVVSEGSQYHSLQWEDIKQVLIANPDFKAGDICGFHLAMNDYTKAKRSFTPGHIAVVAKLDPTLSPYHYIVFEKDFGAFGVGDEASLAYLLRDVLLPLYEGMNYSKLRLVKYGEATDATYRLLGAVKPLDCASPRGL
jgi:hypothetical protein